MKSRQAGTTAGRMRLLVQESLRAMKKLHSYQEGYDGAYGTLARDILNLEPWPVLPQGPKIDFHYNLALVCELLSYSISDGETASIDVAVSKYIPHIRMLVDNINRNLTPEHIPLFLLASLKPLISSCPEDARIEPIISHFERLLEKVKENQESLAQSIEWTT